MTSSVRKIVDKFRYRILSLYDSILDLIEDETTQENIFKSIGISDFL